MSKKPYLIKRIRREAKWRRRFRWIDRNMMPVLFGIVVIGWLILAVLAITDVI